MCTTRNETLGLLTWRQCVAAYERALSICAARDLLDAAALVASTSTSSMSRVATTRSSRFANANVASGGDNDDDDDDGEDDDDIDTSFAAQCRAALLCFVVERAEAGDVG